MPPIDGTDDTPKTALNAPIIENDDVGSRDPNNPPADDKAKEGDNPPSDDKAKEGDDKAKEGDDKAKEGAPENYEAFTMPEGMALDEKAMEAFTPIAKELGLSQENAQKLVDFYATRVQDAQASLAGQWQETTDGWLNEAKNDPEVGGKNWNQTLRDANAFVDKFGDKALREALESVGLGNHVAVLRAFARAGRAISEDDLRGGKPGGRNTPRTRAEILFGSGET